MKSKWLGSCRHASSSLRCHFSSYSSFSSSSPPPPPPPLTPPPPGPVSVTLCVLSAQDAKREVELHTHNSLHQQHGCLATKKPDSRWWIVCPVTCSLLSLTTATVLHGWHSIFVLLINYVIYLYHIMLLARFLNCPWPFLYSTPWLTGQHPKM